MAVRIKILTISLVAVLFSGCAAVSPYRIHPSLDQKAKRLKTVAFLPPRVEVFQLDAGGVREKMDEWSNQARKNIFGAVRTELEARSGLLVTALSEGSLPEKTKSNLEETYTLFDAVSETIVLHTYHQNPDYRFQEKIKNFDYSLGEEVQGLRIGEVDSFLLVGGVDHIWTEGRRALQAFRVLLMVIPVMGGGTGISIAWVDSHSGSILWYRQARSGAGYDLRDRDSATSLVKDLLKDFPIGRKEIAEEEQ